jgi:hypothetical protein
MPAPPDPPKPGFLINHTVEWLDEEGKLVMAEAGSIVKDLPPSAVAWLVNVGHVLPLHGKPPEWVDMIRTNKLAALMKEAERDALMVASQKALLAEAEARIQEAQKAVEVDVEQLTEDRKKWLKEELARLEAETASRVAASTGKTIVASEPVTPPPPPAPTPTPAKEF